MPTKKLPGTVKQAPPGLNGFDINQPLTAGQAASLKTAGYDFCIRYIPRNASLVAGNITHAEALLILNAGLALMAVQHVSQPGWIPNTNLGTVYGNYAANYAKQIVGLPSGMNIWCDLEDVAEHSAPADVIAYCQAWYHAVHGAGYVPGLYVGWGVALTGYQLHNGLSFQHYWRAYNNDSGVATRGFQILQHTQKTIDGLTIDPNMTQNDELGDAALWLSL